MKKSKKPRVSPSDSEELSDMEDQKLMALSESEEDDVDDLDDGEDEEVGEESEEDEDKEEDGEEEDQEDEDEEGDEDEDEDEEEEEEEENSSQQDDDNKDAEMEELEKEYMDLRHQEQDVLKNLKRNKDEDVLKGQAVKNQKALWDKTLEFRFLLQKAFSSSNKLPQDPIRTSFCATDEQVSSSYEELITSSKKTLGSLLELQEALLEKNPSIQQSSNGDLGKSSKIRLNSNESDMEDDEEWLKISEMHKRIVPFRNKSVDKWHRRTQVTTGAAAIKNKLQAFNQDISEQVAAYMRDPSRMIKQMQQSRLVVPVFGTVPKEVASTNGEEAQLDGDPEILDDIEFYQQLLKEFFETVDPASSEAAFYALKRLRTKKRKLVDRRASKSRKIRYNVHDKIVNFMAPKPKAVPPMATKLFENLFGLKTQKTA